MGEDWSNIEIEVIVAEYFIMLKEEIAEKKYNKSEHRRKIAPLLTNRSEGSIEFKLQNISAILSEIGAPWINGYKPRTNYQIPLAERVIEYLKQNPSTLYPIPMENHPAIIQKKEIHSPFDLLIE